MSSSPNFLLTGIALGAGALLVIGVALVFAMIVILRKPKRDV